MQQEKRQTVAAIQKPQNIIMESRKRLSVTGVNDIESFDEHEVNVLTELGFLRIEGDGLHIGRLNTENGDLSISGKIRSVTYRDTKGNTGSLLARLFK